MNIEYSYLEEQVQELMGRGNLLTEESGAIRNFLSRRIKYLWRYYEWPFIRKTGESRTASNKVINLTESGKDDIGDVFAVYETDPQGGSASKKLNFVLNQDTIYVPSLSTDATEAFVTYRARPPRFRGPAYSASTTYSLGNEVYGATTATDGTTQTDYYKSLRNSNLGNALTDTNDWEKITIPEQFGDVLVHMIYSDILRSEQSWEEAARHERVWRDLLLNEISIVEQQQSQQYPINFNSHNITQSRNASTN